MTLAFILTGCGGILQSGNSQPAMEMVGDNICRDNINSLMWQFKVPKQVTTIEEARQYAADLELDGYNDWRVPTVYELYELSYLVDLHKNGDCEIDISGNFWSDEKDGEGMVGAWEISDQCEPERQYYEKMKGYVRAVRP